MSDGKGTRTNNPARVVVTTLAKTVGLGATQKFKK